MTDTITPDDLPWNPGFKIIDVPKKYWPETYYCYQCGYGFSSISQPVKPENCPNCGKPDWDKPPKRNGTI